LIWQRSHRFDKRAVALADRHYNRQKPGTPQFMPPGSCRVLVANNNKAVFGLSFPKAEFVKHAWSAEQLPENPINSIKSRSFFIGADYV